MQLTIISDTHATLIIDKVEHNPLTIGEHPAWAANGTLINVGGNPVVGGYTSAADFGDLDGLQAVRIFEPCQSSSADHCTFYENHSRIRMASPRWYNTVIRISDGGAMIIGRSKKGGWINNETVNNPTIEYWPPKSLQNSMGLLIHLPSFVRTLNANLFPIVFSLPDDRIFISANRDAIMYDWQKNQEQELPRIPNECQVTYPMAGAGLLLPLSPEDGYTAEILLCGGSSIDDKKPGYEISSQDPASASALACCLRIKESLQGWFSSSTVLGPESQAMATSSIGLDSRTQTTQFSLQFYTIPLPPLLLYGNEKWCDTKDVPLGRITDTQWRYFGGREQSELESEPVVHNPPEALRYGQNLTLGIQIPPSTNKAREIKVALMDLGFITHAVHANSRLPAAYPPGPGWIYIVVDGVPSIGFQVIVGSGDGPPVDQAAWDKCICIFYY
ncbi:hypothetical protein K503DRAFT_797528 [Rhizopogon vinicolor AM-OR11-026]|uniref:Galactose oxidase-like Early set domain-containing protein n=1 Tax=Rhizopogon vinicolor AM-OR11-026 TaxID=1314800 RepID=A0A1B7NAY9_9AGAM|nr:hypothetical protein K503DRAFT_797528 [Rhizopogon vinicolor AM-OR11-026]